MRTLARGISARSALLALAASTMMLGLAPDACLAQRYLPVFYSKALAIPEPMKVEWKASASFPLSGSTALVAPAGTSNQVRQIAADLKRLLRDLFATDPQLLFTDLIPEKNAIVLGTLEDSTALRDLFPNIPREQFGNFPDQGYVITSTPQRVVLIGRSAEGLKYGIQTLLQIIAPGISIGTYVVPPVEIVDFPATEMRALLLPFGSYRQLYQMAKIRELISVAQSLHMNTIILQVNDATIFDSAPTIARSGATHKDTLRAMVQYAREAGLEVIPLVSTLSQQGSLLCAAHPTLCLDENTYDPANPKVYAKLFGILDEVIEIFQPRYLHIGHDKVLAFLKMSEADAQRLFLSDVRKIYEHLKSRNVGTMMWADMLVHAQNCPGQENCHGFLGGIYTIIDSLPRDIVMVDAQYRQRSPDYPSMDFLLSKGFPVVGCVGSDTTTVNNFSKYAAERGVRVDGMIVAVWDWYKYAGMHTPTETIWRGAQAFWRGGIPPVDPTGRKTPPALRDINY